MSFAAVKIIRIRYAVIFLFGFACAPSDDHARDVTAALPIWLNEAPACPSTLLQRPSIFGNVQLEACQEDMAQCVAACQSGDAEWCFSAGVAHEVLDRADLANAYLARACELGNDLSCVNLAVSLRDLGIGNDACITDTYKEACERDVAWGCALAAVSFVEGFGVAQDLSQSEAYAIKACEIDPSKTEMHHPCRLAESILEENSP